MITAKYFQTWMGRYFPMVVVLAALTLALGLYQVFFQVPFDYQQKETVRIMFIHVPAAWLALGVYGAMGLFNLSGFIFSTPFLFVIARSIAPLGFVMTLVCIGTGMLWGKPMWGAWWVWDARLTSVAILGLLYAAYMIFTASYAYSLQSLRVGAMISLIGCVNLPIIKFSVNWWNSLHQGASVLRMDGPTIHPSMLVPLLVMAAGFALWVFVLSCLRVETALLQNRQNKTRRRANLIDVKGLQP